MKTLLCLLTLSFAAPALADSIDDFNRQMGYYGPSGDQRYPQPQPDFGAPAPQVIYEPREEPMSPPPFRDWSEGRSDVQGYH